MSHRSKELAWKFSVVPPGLGSHFLADPGLRPAGQPRAAIAVRASRAQTGPSTTLASLRSGRNDRTFVSESVSVPE